jgi:hypothetical protein
MADDLAQPARVGFAPLTGRVADLQALVREHAEGRPTPQALADSLRRAGLDARADDAEPGGRRLVRVADGDLTLFFEPADGGLSVIDVRRPRTSG